MPDSTSRVVLSLGMLVIGFTSGAHAEGDSSGSIRVTGCRIKPANHVTLSVNQSGILSTVPEEGTTVDMGQLVIQLEDELARASLVVAEKEAVNDVDIRFSEIAADVANLEYEQAVKVNESVKGSMTMADIRRRKLEYDRSVAQTEQARFKQAIAVLKRDESAAQLKTFHVAAPFTGMVNKVMKHPGEAVRQGEPILEMVNTRRVRIEGYLDVPHRRRVAAGTAVEALPESHKGEGPEKPCRGKVVFVDSVVQPVTQQVRFWAEVENPDETLLPGLTASITIQIGAVPVAATRDR